MKNDIGERLVRLNRKYSHYGEIQDYDKDGSDEEVTVPWGAAKLIVLERDDYSCRICGKSPMVSENKNGVERLRVEVEVHHIIPRIAGGSNSTRNLITLCKDCHIKTFKNNYTGVPSIARRLDERVEVLTNSKVLLKRGNNCKTHSLTSFHYKNREVILKEPLDCEICEFPSLKMVYDIVFGNALDIEEIIIKDKNKKFCLGIIEK
ncbi:MAG: HNH endonuclease [Thermoplasmatales archaeon]